MKKIISAIILTALLGGTVWAQYYPYPHPQWQQQPWQPSPLPQLPQRPPLPQGPMQPIPIPQGPQAPQLGPAPQLPPTVTCWRIGNMVTCQ
jgi:hypothetical protein